MCATCTKGKVPPATHGKNTGKRGNNATRSSQGQPDGHHRGKITVAQIPPCAWLPDGSHRGMRPCTPRCHSSLFAHATAFSHVCGQPSGANTRKNASRGPNLGHKFKPTNASTNATHPPEFAGIRPFWAKLTGRVTLYRSPPT